MILLLAACQVGSGPADDPPAAPERTDLAAVVASSPQVGAVRTIDPLRVVTPPSPIDGAVVAQDPVTGQGVLVQVGARVTGWPPALHQEIAVSAVWLNGSPPTIGLHATTSLLARRAVQAPVVTPFDGTQPAWTLVEAVGVRVASSVDPLGRADTEPALGLEDRFGVGLPGYGAEGDLRAVVGSDGRLWPADAASWVELSPPIEAREVTIAELRGTGLRPGTPVQVVARAVTPFSEDGRWLLLQDEAGDGIWVDAAGYGPWRLPTGLARWDAELRFVSGAAVLRAWGEPANLGGDARRIVAPDISPVDGRVVRLRPGPSAAPDAWGDRLTDAGFLLDDRYVNLVEVPAVVVGAWMVRGNEARLVVLP